MLFAMERVLSFAWWSYPSGWLFCLRQRCRGDL